MYEILVIGAGPAGVTAALRASELGAKVALVERGRMGGTCTNDGCVPTRVMAKAARLMREAEQFSLYGIHTNAPALDFAQLLQRTQHIVYAIHEKKQLISHMRDAGIEVFSEVGEARFTDPHTVALPDGRTLQAEKFILCAGGRARRLDFPGAEKSITHSDVWELRSIPKSLVIVGGAATGCQVASIFEAFGTQVTILERTPRILSIEDESVVSVIEGEFSKRGIRIITEIETVDRIEDGPDGVRVYYRQDGLEHALDTEAAVLSAGWVGNLSSLNLPAANVETVGPYVQVDDYMRTSAEHIFAAGDINGKMMLVQSAGYEAVAAAENAVLGVGQPQTHPLVPHGGFTDPEYASVGLTETDARAQHEIEVAEVTYAELDRAVIDGRTVGLCKLIVSQENHRLLGAHVVGEQALEIVHVVAAGMAADMWVEQLAELEIAYPTFTAILGLAARKIVDKLGVRPLSPKWRALGKPLAIEWERSDG